VKGNASPHIHKPSMKTTETTPALLRLPIARTAPARAAFIRCQDAAGRAIAQGWTLRKGSIAPSARRRILYLYATPPDGPERRIWSEETNFGGYHAPLTGPRLFHLESALDALIQAAPDDDDDCPACSAPCDGPVPPYCPEHDGSYSDFLAFNNCD
jgi:hypothetical protein